MCGQGNEASDGIEARDNLCIGTRNRLSPSYGRRITSDREKVPAGRKIRRLAMAYRGMPLDQDRRQAIAEAREC
jgi:hypothetical protein